MKAATFDQTVRDNLLAIAGAYARAEGVPLSRVARRCYGNVNFFANLRKTGDVSAPTVEKTLSWFRKNWPENADWPFLPAIFMDRDPPAKK